MSEAKGVLVQALVEGGAASAAGIKEGDVILSVDGREVNRQNELQSYIATHHQGDEVTLKIFREGKTLEKKVTLRPKSGDQLAAKDKDEQKDESEISEEAAENGVIRRTRVRCSCALCTGKEVPRRRNRCRRLRGEAIR